VGFSSRAREASDAWQAKLWFLLVGLILVAGFLLAFVVKNDEQVEVDFVFGTASTSLIWTILLSLGLGVVVGVLLSQLYRRRRRKRGGQPGDAVGDRVRVDEAEG
jgi:uncharacterized integral membrane protein